MSSRQVYFLTTEALGFVCCHKATWRILSIPGTVLLMQKYEASQEGLPTSSVSGVGWLLIIGVPLPFH